MEKILHRPQETVKWNLNLPVRLKQWIFLVWVLVPVEPTGAQAQHQRLERRTALVICVADYEGAGFHSLAGVDVDRKVMTEALQKTGFEVTTLFNPGLAEARMAVDDFIDKLNTRGGTAFFYFSGHGVVAANHNHLLFGEERLSDGFSNLWEEAISAQVVLQRMENSPASVRIVLMDCCRHRVTEFSGSDLNNRLKTGSFIGYATSGESVPAHADGSRFTESFARHMQKPGVSLEDIQMLVNQDLSSRSDRYLSLPQFRDRLSASNAWSFRPGVATPLMVSSGQIHRFGGIQFVWCPGDVPLLPATEVRDGVVRPRQPPHDSLRRGFWISQTEVTNWQWRSVMGRSPESPEPILGDGSLPVTQVSWNEAVGFCREMNASRKDELPSGMVFNLPTEAQWEYAARAGTRTAFYFGNDPEGLEAHANFGKERPGLLEAEADRLGLHGRGERLRPAKVGQVSIGDPAPSGGHLDLQPATGVQTPISSTSKPLGILDEFKRESALDPESIGEDFESRVMEALFGSSEGGAADLPVPDHTPFRPVGQFLPNPWRLYDVYGNAAEWCLITEDRPALLRGPRALGGSVFSSATQCRTGEREHWSSPDSRHPDIGFRLVISHEAVPEIR